LSLASAIMLFLVFATVIAITGTQLSKAADELADLTGIGEALVGGVLLGAFTSLPGIVTSVVAAYEGHPHLAISNAIGGIAAQTVFLSVADLAYRNVNLEHAAASFSNLMQGLLLIILLSTVLLLMSGAEITVAHVHPGSFLLILIYFFGIRLISRAREKPMWRPRQTPETVLDKKDEATLRKKSLKWVAFKFLGLAVIIAFAGYMVAKTGISIAAHTGLSESFVGGIFTAIATSLPELIVTVSAVRQKALTLAVSNIIGGNTFDALFIAFADFAYFKGSILHRLATSHIYIIALAMVLTSVLILGLLVREKTGIGKIGWESFLILLLYVGGNLVLYFM